MSSPEINRRVASVMCLVLPVILVKAVGMLAGFGEPDQASAEPQAADVVAAVSQADPGTAKWTDAQLAAARRVNELAQESFGPVPLLYAPAVEEPAEPAPVVEQKVEPPQTLDHIVLQVIMASRSGGGDTALINGRPYQEGDIVRSCGWRVLTIDSANRSIVLQEPNTGRTLTKSVQLPR
jgi:hypothetical protein